MTLAADELRDVPLCGRCRNGEVGECHTPGCALWMNRAPDVPIQLEGTLGGPDLSSLGQALAEAIRHDAKLNGIACSTAAARALAKWDEATANQAEETT